MSAKERLWDTDGGITIKTDNMHEAEKVALRVLAVTELGEPRDIHVLDAYHGHGHVWRAVERVLPEGWNVHLFAVDNQARRASTLKVDNVRLLASIDLARFDLIDLDAYGWPVHQLIHCAGRAPDVPVLTTRSTKAISRVPTRVLTDIGINWQSAETSWSGDRRSFPTRIRLAVIRRDPICRCAGCPDCGPPCTEPSTIADHKIPHAEGGDDTIANGQGMCDPCHGHKTRAEIARGRARPRRQDDLPPFTLINHIADEVWEAWLHHLGYTRSRLYYIRDLATAKRYELLTR